MDLCFASRNAHKLSEVQAMLPPDIRLIGLDDIGCREELPETHETIEENAAEKAAFVWDHYHVPCFADDSGLEVLALGGAPGVHSAHYAGPHRSHLDNYTLLLRNLQGVTDRRARFRTVIALRTSEGQHLFQGSLEGTILQAPRGDQGFGYDPVFLPNGSNRSLAEIPLEEKNTISHRADALLKLVHYLRH